MTLLLRIRYASTALAVAVMLETNTSPLSSVSLLHCLLSLQCAVGTLLRVFAGCLNHPSSLAAAESPRLVISHHSHCLVNKHDQVM